MALLDEVRANLRVTSELTDDEIQMWVSAALADMKRVGIDETLLAEGSMDPLARGAVTLYVKGHYGYDNDEAPRFLSHYRQTVAALLNSPANTAQSSDEG